MKARTVLLLIALLYVCGSTYAQNITSSVPLDPSNATPKETGSVSSISKAPGPLTMSKPGPSPSPSVIGAAPPISSKAPSPLATAAQPPTSRQTSKPSSDAVINSEKLKYTALFIMLFNLGIILVI